MGEQPYRLLGRFNPSQAVNFGGLWFFSSPTRNKGPSEVDVFPDQSVMTGFQ